VHATEQYVSNTKEAIELIERALINRRFRYNPDSFLLLQFTIVHIEALKPKRNEVDSNISLESASLNRRSYLRVFDGVNLIREEASSLILGQPI
jgi:hypothetical protein